MTIPVIACIECCDLYGCDGCLALEHENCDEDCEYCRAQARKREAERYCDAQFAYYAKGGFFDTIFDGAFDEGLAPSTSNPAAWTPPTFEDSLAYKWAKEDEDRHA